MADGGGVVALGEAFAVRVCEEGVVEVEGLPVVE